MLGPHIWSNLENKLLVQNTLQARINPIGDETLILDLNSPLNEQTPSNTHWAQHVQHQKKPSQYLILFVDIQYVPS